MSLDQNLFTLNVIQRQEDRSIVDLIDTKGVLHYTKRRLPVNEYKIEVYDPVSEGILATVSAPSATSKHKTLQLHNPDIIVELKFTGTLSFKWGFKWEDHSFEWKREECFMLRKPDPSVLVALTKEPPGRLQTRAVQILDYNLNRFDIEDRKGLEIVILTALLTFSDQNESYHASREGSTSTATTPPALSTPLGYLKAPPVPPKPAPLVGVDRVAEMHTIRTAQGEGEANEILVGEECSVDDYAQYAGRLLNDEAMLLVSIRSATAAQVPKVLRVVEETKWARHRSGIAEEEELHQYVIYESNKPKGPKRINLDISEPKRDKSKDYVPPTSVIVHLSKIDMPELRPKLSPDMRRSSGGSSSASSPVFSSPTRTQAMTDKERRKAENESKRAERESKKAGEKAAKERGNDKSGKGKGKGTEKAKEKEKDKREKIKDKDKDIYDLRTPSPSLLNKLTKPTSSAIRRSSSFSTPSHKRHPHQPSPSPSQLNNPAIYMAPPPRSSRARPMSMAFPTPTFDDHAVAFPIPDAPLGTPPRPPSNFPPQLPARRMSFYQSSSGKGPVTALLEMWSKN